MVIYCYNRFLLETLRKFSKYAMDLYCQTRKNSPGAESFYSARETDTASLASFYMDAYDDLTADEYQSAFETDRELTPTRQEERANSAESTPRHSPSEQLRQQELLLLNPNKRHSHDLSIFYRNEPGKPLVLQRSTSYMGDNVFAAKPLKKTASYSPVHYLNDSYDSSYLSKRRPPPNRARQWKISMERMAEKEREKKQESESRSELRMALECPVEIPLPQPREMELIKSVLDETKPAKITNHELHSNIHTLVNNDSQRKQVSSGFNENICRADGTKFRIIKNDGTALSDDTKPVVPLCSTKVKDFSFKFVEPLEVSAPLPQKDAATLTSSEISNGFIEATSRSVPVKPQPLESPFTELHSSFSTAYAPVARFSRTASFDSTPTFPRKTTDNMELQFSTDLPSNSRGNSQYTALPLRPSPIPIYPTPTLVCVTPPRSPKSSAPRPLSPATEISSLLPLSKFRPLLNTLPPAGRNSSSAKSQDDVPRRPARSRRGTRSAHASRQHSVTRDDMRDSTRDLQEQIQSLLSSLKKRLNKSGSLRRLPTGGGFGNDDSGELSPSRSNTSLSEKPTRYSSIKRESTMEKLENILSSSSETKKVGMFDAESIEELSTYGRIGDYGKANNTESAIFEEFDKHFDLMLEADSGEEDDFVKITDDGGQPSSSVSQTFFSGALSKTQERRRSRAKSPPMNESDCRDRKGNWGCDDGSPLVLPPSQNLYRISPPRKALGTMVSEPPLVPAKQRTSRDEQTKLFSGSAPEQASLKGTSNKQQQIINQQSEQLKKLQKNQEELEEKMRLLQIQLEQQQKYTEPLFEQYPPPLIHMKRGASRVFEAENHYNQLPAAASSQSAGNSAMVSPYSFAGYNNIGVQAQSPILNQFYINSPLQTRNNRLQTSKPPGAQLCEERLLVASLTEMEYPDENTIDTTIPMESRMVRQDGMYRLKWA